MLSFLFMTVSVLFLHFSLYSLPNIWKSIIYKSIHTYKLNMLLLTFCLNILSIYYLFIYLSMHFHTCIITAYTNNEINQKKSQNLNVIFSCRWGAILITYYDLYICPPNIILDLFRLLFIPYSLLWPSIHLFIHPLSIYHPYLYLSIISSICPYLYKSIYPTIYLYLHPFIYYLSISPSIYLLSIYISTRLISVSGSNSFSDKYSF